MKVQTSETYHYGDEQPSHTFSYLMPTLEESLRTFFDANPKMPKTVFDLGCGNGSTANALANQGYSVSGVDPSEEGIKLANQKFPNADLRTGSAYDDLESIFGRSSAVISMEVVEHVYAPRDYITTVKSLIAPGGVAIISTPYHGYLKNLSIALLNRFDQHVDPLWDHGHIKFWSPKTLTALASEAGLELVDFHFVGRFSMLAKSMIAVFRARQT